MPVVDINGRATPTITGAWSGWNPIWCTAAVPLARQAANGGRYALVNALNLYGGSGGAIGIYAANADGSDYQSSGAFGSVASGGWNTGWRGITKWFGPIAPGWEVRFGFTHSATLYYGRHTPVGGNIYNRDGIGPGQLEWTGASLSGQFSYHEVPAAPAMIGAVVQPDGTTKVTFSGSGDTGGTAITGWVLQYATNPSFSGATTIASSGTSYLTLTPGLYYFRAAGRNIVSDHYGTTGPWSGALSSNITGGGKRWTGTAWQSLSVSRRWDGTSWVNLATKKRWNGTAWVNLT